MEDEKKCPTCNKPIYSEIEEYCKCGFDEKEAQLETKVEQRQSRPLQSPSSSSGTRNETKTSSGNDQYFFKVDKYLTAKASLDIDTLYDNAASVFDQFCSQDASAKYLKLGVIEFICKCYHQRIEVRSIGVYYLGQIIEQFVFDDNCRAEMTEVIWDEMINIVSALVTIFYTRGFKRFPCLRMKATRTLISNSSVKMSSLILKALVGLLVKLQVLRAKTKRGPSTRCTMRRFSSEESHQKQTTRT